MPLPKAPQFDWSLGKDVKRIAACRVESPQVKVTISVCGIEIGCIWIIFVDQSSIDVLLQVETLTPTDFYPFDPFDNIKALLHKVVKKYSRKQIEAIHQYGVERISYHLNDVAEMELYQVHLSGNRVLVDLPFECIVSQNKQSLGWIHFVFVLEERNDMLSKVEKVNVSWPDINSAIISKIPDWNPDTLAREYTMKFQQMVNQKQKKLMTARTMRQKFVLEIDRMFSSYLLERDDEEFLFVSMYIMIATGDEILGAAVCNFHLENYPETSPKIFLTSPLFFESTNSYKPASKEIIFDYQPNWSAAELCASIKDQILDQIVGFHSQLINDISRA